MHEESASVQTHV